MKLGRFFTKVYSAYDETKADVEVRSFAFRTYMDPKKLKPKINSSIANHVS